MHTGCFFFDTELYGLFDIPSWYVLGGFSKILYAARGVESGKQHVVDNELVGVCELSFFESNERLTSAVLTVGGVLFQNLFVCVVQQSGNCLIFPYSDLPVLGYFEKPFVINDSFNLWSMDVFLGIISGMFDQSVNCLSFACILLMNIINPRVPLSVDVLERHFSIHGRNYLSVLSDYAETYGYCLCTELLQEVNVARFLQLLQCGYLLLVPLEVGMVFDLEPKSFVQLSRRHAVLCAQISDDEFIFIDRGGLRIWNKSMVLAVFNQVEHKPCDGWLLCGIRDC